MKVLGVLSFALIPPLGALVFGFSAWVAHSEGRSEAAAGAAIICAVMTVITLFTLRMLWGQRH